jgi:hypothetical protein
MPNIVILYKLKSEISPQQFETWMRETDFPALRAMKHVKSFVTYRVGKRAMSSALPSIDYVEIFDVPDLMSFLAEDLADEKTQTVMKDFRQFVDDPEYLITEPVV